MSLESLLYALLVCCLCGCPAQRKNRESKKPEVSQEDVMEEGVPKPTPPASVVPLRTLENSFVLSFGQYGGPYSKRERSFALFRSRSERAEVACGTKGTVAARVADCRKKDPQAELKIEFNRNVKSWWSLVLRGADGSEVWRDNLTGLVWSDVIEWKNGTEYPWCYASGSNNKSGSPYSDDSSCNICMVEHRQRQEKPKSLCAEDVVYLGGTLKSSPAKGGLGKLKGATTPVSWWLPSLGDFSVAEAHGLNQIFPFPGNRQNNLESSDVSYGSFWTSSFYDEVLPREQSCIGRFFFEYRFNYMNKGIYLALDSELYGLLGNTDGFDNEAKVRCVGAP